MHLGECAGVGVALLPFRLPVLIAPSTLAGGTRSRRNVTRLSPGGQDQEHCTY